MAIRSDITVNLSTSPRTIDIPSPSTSVTVTDLIDTLNSIAASANPPIHAVAHTSGGFFGPTLMLLDSHLVFSGHTGFTNCTLEGGVVLSDQTQVIGPSSNVQVTIVQGFNAMSGGDELTVERFLQLTALLGEISGGDVVPTNNYISNTGDVYVDNNDERYISN